MIYTSDVKKLYSWYNLLVAAGKVDLEEPEADEAEEPAADEQKAE